MSFEHFLTSPNGMQRYWRDNHDDTFTICTTQDLTATLDYCRDAYNLNDGYSETREFRRVGFLPDILVMKWLQEEGWNAYDPDCEEKLLRKINDPDYAHLRNRSGAGRDVEADMIDTYSKLQDAVAQYAQRTDLTDIIPDFIATAHRQIVAYYGPLAVLSLPSDTNDMLVMDPQIYLWGALAEAGAYLRDSDLVGAYQEKFMDRLQHYGLQPSTASVALDPSTQPGCE